MIPMMMRLKVRGEDARINLWIPLFLVWILLGILGLLLLPVWIILILLAPLIPELRQWGRFVLSALGMLGHLTGLRIRVRGDKDDVDIHF